MAVLARRCEVTECPSSLAASSRSRSRPSAEETAPSESDTATILWPSAASSRAMCWPALPKPWMATRMLAVQAEFLGEVAHQIVAAARGGIAAAERTAERDRLAGDDGGHGLADDLGVFVGHPAHDHRVGVDVGRGNVAVGADDAGERLDVGARQALQLGLGKLARIDLHRALAAAIGQVHHGALEGHPERQRLDFVVGRVGMEADAALGRAARVVISASPGQERFSRPVVHADHQADLGRLAGEFQLSRSHRRRRKGARLLRPDERERDREG